jgi:hypothetical protein
VPGQWTEITTNIPAKARGKWVAHIEPSHFDDGLAYVVFTGYRLGDDAPYLYRMTQLGKERLPFALDHHHENCCIVLSHG